jgi:organic radical activating enzyme
MLPCPIYVQPMDSKDDEQNKQNLAAALNSAMKFGYILQLQIHKIIGVE